MFVKNDKLIGVGINYRTEIGKDILAFANKIDCLEVYTEKFFINDDDPVVQEIIKTIPLVLHGLDLSVGSSADISDSYFNNLKNLLNKVNFEWFSDHISLTQEEDIEVGHLMPIQFSEQVAENIIKKVKAISCLSDKPFLLENITYYYPVPGGTMSEPEFISHILEKADCGMLLDINNLYINSVNHHYDPHKFLEQIPKDRVVEIHMAGGSTKYNMLIDTHANPISEPVWNLLEYAIQRIAINAIIIERDSNLPRYTDLLQEVERARHLLLKHGLLNG